MAKFSLKDSDEYYLALSDPPKRFDADSPVTNVFFDDTNGQVVTVRSGGVTGVTVTGMEETKCTSFTMEDKGPINSIKFSPDHKILAIQRNIANQPPCVEFVNFKDLAPTNVEYCHVCKWKNAKILGFVWPKANEIAFITDHGIELLQVLPEKKQLKSLKSTSFSGAWFSWCAQSNTVLLAGNNGALLQPFLLNNSTITKLQKLELDSAKPVVERDVFVIRVCGATWCAVLCHGNCASPTTPGPTEVWMMPITGSSATHVLKTGQLGRFAINVVDDLVVVHHQSSQTSLLFDIQEDTGTDQEPVVHIPIVPATSIQPARVDDAPCPMYSGNWVVFQPRFVVDARAGTLWTLALRPAALAHQITKDEISKIVAVLLRRKECKQTVYDILHQLVSNAREYLVELGRCFDEINATYRKWADLEMARNTAGQSPEKKVQNVGTVISQSDMCCHILQPHADDKYIVQVITQYLYSLNRHDIIVQAGVAEACVRAVVTRGALSRLRALVRRGALAAQRPLACQLLSLGHMDPASAQLATDMMCRLNAMQEIVEVLLSWDEPVSAVGAARQASSSLWHSVPARKLLEAAKCHSEAQGDPSSFVAIYHALQNRNEKLRGSPHFLKGEQCDSYVEYYKQVTAE